MPLLFIKSAGKTGKVGLWHITETLHQIHTLKDFSTLDIEWLKMLRHERRKKEGLIARILTEKLMERNAEIIYDEYNKPFLKGSQKNISISHSHNLLAVIVDEKKTGIDIECVKSNISHIKHKFMSDLELKKIKNDYETEMLTICWCVKESLYKLYGKKQLSFKENIRIEPFEYSEKGIIYATIESDLRKNRYKLLYENIPDPVNSSQDGKNYILSYITNED